MSMLSHHRQVLQDRRGNALSLATVTVTNIAGSAATLYSDRSGSEAVGSNVLTADVHGEVSFYAAPGYYSLAVHLTGYDDYTVTALLANSSQFTVGAYDSLSDACEDAAAEDATLTWSGEQIIVTGNIANFWSCEHVGRGRITRGTDTFYIRPRRSQVNRVYINPTGSNSNDGLTSSFPFATLQAAVNAVADFAEVLPGRWEFILASGTHTGTVVVPSQLRSVYPITIKGPTAGHPNVPTAVLAPTSAGDVILTVSEGRAWFLMQDIKFSGATTGTALNLNGGVRVGLINGHIAGCLNGIVNQHGSMLSPSGGIWTGLGKAVAGGLGLFSTYASTHAFTGTDASDGVQITGWERGVLVNEGAQGHLDGIQISTCGTGYITRRGAGASNTRFMAIDGCDVGVAADTPWFEGIAFGATTPNGIDVQPRGDAPEFDFNVQDHSVRTPRLIESVYLSPHTGTINETVIYEFDDIREWMISEAGNDLEISMIATKTGSADTCSMRVYVSDGVTDDLVASVTIPAPAGNYRPKANIHFSNTNAQRGQAWLEGGSSGVGNYQTGAIDLKHQAGSVKVTLELANAADSIALPLVKLIGTIGG